MRLKRIEISGFKSFSGKTQVEVSQGTTAIVGPNGCGKSNFVDAILWGLGESNVRSLRGVSAQDLIFNGSSSQKPVGLAEVKLWFDNEDRKLPVDQDEVVFARRVNRQGEYDYEINRRRCRQRDFHELLAESGLGKNGYAIVGQKEIDFALSATPEERRGWIEEAAGIQRFRLRRDDTLKKLERSEQELTRCEDVVRELIAQRDEIADEAAIAREYRSALETLKQYELQILVNDTLEALEELEVLKEKRDDELKSLATLESESRKVSETRQGLNRKIEEAEAKHNEVSESLTKNRAELASAQTEQKIVQERLVSVKQQQQDLFGELEQAETIDTLKVKIEALQLELKQKQQNLDELKKLQSLDTPALEKLEQEMREVSDSIRAAKAAEAARLEQVFRVREQRATRQRLEGELKDLEGGLPGFVSADEEAKAALQELESKRSSLTESSAKAREAILARETNVSSILKEVSERERTVQSINGRIEGNEAAIASIVKSATEPEWLSGFDKVKPLGASIEVKKPYGQAIEALLEDLTMAIPLSSRDELESILKGVPEPAVGRAHMLTPSTRDNSESTKLPNDALCWAIDAVEFEPGVEAVIRNVLWKLAVVENRADAVRLSKSHPELSFVTLKGDVFRSNGLNLVGESAKNRKGVIVLKAELKELRKTGEKLRSEIVSLEEKLSKARDLLEDEKQSLQDIQKERDQVQVRFEHALREREATGARRTQAENALAKLSAEISALKDAEPDDHQAVDIASLEQRRETLIAEISAFRAQADSRREAMAAIGLQIRSIEESIKGLQRIMETELESQRRKADKVQQFAEEAVRLENRLENCTKKLQEAIVSVERLQRLAEEASALRQSLREEVRLAEQQADRMGEELGALRDSLARLELKVVRVDSRKSAALLKLFEDHGLTEEEVSNSDPFELEDGVPELCAQLRRKMKSMGAVNLATIEHFERLEERITELLTQSADVKAAIDELRASIEDLDKITKTRFLEAFDDVSQRFDRLFAELFPGGTAQLSLTDPEKAQDAGIHLSVQLPGKRSQRLEVLSGGERALAASAFLFALIQANPSPLIVLDEVDAPLDGRNIERFNDLIQQFAAESQLLIVTHNPATIERSESWLGFTMQKPGVTQVVSYTPEKAPTSPLDGTATTAAIGNSGH
ncbi:MAG: chromosome segregation protein SMC [Fimbriimonadaceae bacterium]